MSSEDDDDASSAMRQRLMTADEVYLYKIPPMKNASGHRAEDWNLANPLKTCSLLVERRGDAIALEFQHGSPAQQFALATLDVTKGGNAKSFLEPAVDSSRYFVVKIQGDGNREALIGFGFRDRDDAIDLREALQHYEKSLQRQEKAASSLTGSFSIPLMEEGQQIHVNLGSNGKKSTSVRKKEKDQHATSSAPTLLKKPPPPAAEEDGGVATSSSVIPEAAPAAAAADINPKVITKMAISMGDIDLDADHIKNSASGDGGDDDSGDNSGGAVYVGDEEQWKTEFDMPK